MKAPRVNDRRVDEATGERKRFSSRILPPWCRKSPKISEVLPVLYLHGLSTGDFVLALEQFLGGAAAGLSAGDRDAADEAVAGRGHAAFQDRDLSGRDYVYVWADGVHPKVRLGRGGTRACWSCSASGWTAPRSWIALAEGLRESTESWADLLRDCRRRGMRDPVLVVGDGALGLWKALGRGVPQQPGISGAGFTKARNRDRPSRSPRSGARRRQSRTSTTPRTAAPRRRSRRSPRLYGAKFPKAVTKIADDQAELPRSTTSPPSTGSSCGPRIRSSRRSPRSGSGPRSPRRGLAPAPSPWSSSWSSRPRQRWRAVNAPHPVALVRAGARFERGRLVERPVTEPVTTNATAA